LARSRAPAARRRAARATLESNAVEADGAADADGAAEADGAANADGAADAGGAAEAAEGAGGALEVAVIGDEATGSVATVVGVREGHHTAAVMSARPARPAA
jgi:pilus assembly protein FimV